MSATNTPIRLTIVAPCYHTEGGLAELYRRVTFAARLQVGDDSELILVNHGSPDGTGNPTGALSNSGT
jgi:hypothetical protein